MIAIRIIVTAPGVSHTLSTSPKQFLHACWEKKRELGVGSTAHIKFIHVGSCIALGESQNSKDVVSGL